MFSHSQVWSAIDALAQRHDMSVSRLARNAGLDPTTFNKSKRVATDGRLRWPSTESLFKIMVVTDTGINDFAALVSGNGSGPEFGLQYVQPDHLGFADSSASPVYAPPTSVPLIGIAQAGSGGFFDDAGLPLGEGWDAVDFPRQDSDLIYALEIQGESMLPLYRDGDRIIVSPTSSVRRGDRVVVRTSDGEVMAKVLARKTANVLEVESLNPDHQNRVFDLSEIDWVARIIWASQ